jgi:hypothetical protein
MLPCFVLEINQVNYDDSHAKYIKIKTSLKYLQLEII